MSARSPGGKQPGLFTCKHMPGEISRSSAGPSDGVPYLPEWIMCYGCSSHEDKRRSDAYAECPKCN